MLVQEESGADKKNSLVVDNDPRRNIVQSTLEVHFEEETTSDEQIFHLLNKSLGNLTKKFTAEKTNWWRERLRMILKEAEREKGLEGDLPALNHLGEQDTHAGEPLSLGGGGVKTLHKRDDKLRMIAAKKKELSRVSKAKTKQGKSVKPRKYNKEKGKVRKSDKKENNEKNSKKIFEGRLPQKKRKIRKILRVDKIRQKKKQFEGNGQKKRLLVERNKDLNTCTALWAKYTNMALGKYGKASTLLKQANSIINSDKITKSKSEKGEEFNEHKDILQQVLDKGQCPGTTKRGAKATGIQGWL